MKKQTRLMSKVFSDATPPEEKVAIAGNIAEAKENGFSEDDDHTYASNDDGDVEIKDKFTGETTVHSGIGEAGEILLEPKTEVKSEPSPEELALGESIKDTKKLADAEVNPEAKEKLEQKVESLTSLYSKTFGKTYAEVEETTHTMSHHTAHKLHSGLAAHHKAQQKKFSEEGDHELAEAHGKLAEHHESIADEHKEAIDEGKGDEKVAKKFSDVETIIDTKGDKKEISQQNVLPVTKAQSETPIAKPDVDAPPVITETKEEIPPVVTKPPVTPETKIQSDNDEMTRLMDPEKNNKGFLETKKEADPKDEKKPDELAPKVSMEEPKNEAKTFSTSFKKDDPMEQFNNLITQNLRAPRV